MIIIITYNVGNIYRALDTLIWGNELTLTVSVVEYVLYMIYCVVLQYEVIIYI